MGTRHRSPILQSNRNATTKKITGVAKEPTKSGSLWAIRSSVWPAHPSITRRISPDECTLKYPIGIRATWRTIALRIFAAIRKAARCEAMSAPRYTMMLNTAKTTASTAHIAADDASAQFGYTEIKSRTTNHTQTSGITVSTAFSAERPHPTYAKTRRLPANPNSSRIAFFFLAGPSFPTSFPTPAVRVPSSRVIAIFTSRPLIYMPSLAKCFENTLVPMKPPTRPPAMVAAPVTTPIGPRIELTSVWPYSRVMPA